MKVTGSLTKLTVEAALSMGMAISMRECGRTTKLTAMASTRTQTEPSTKATGSTISKMGRARRTGRTVLAMKVITSKGRSTASVNSYGLTGHLTLENS